MKKSLIALAVVGAFTAQAAMADVTIYGAANVSFDAVNDGYTSTTVTNAAAVAADQALPVPLGVLPTFAAGSTGTNHIASNVSKLGFKGSEDLGDGLSAVFQIETLIAIDGTAAATTIGDRNTYAGLSSATMGTVLFGRHDTPYKIATRGMDLFADTIADNRSIMGMTVVRVSEDARLTNVAAYISPAMSGFTVAVATVAGAETPVNGASKGSAWSLAGLYNAGPINASLAYQVIDNGDTGTGSMGAILLAQAAPAQTSKAKAWKLGGGYTMDQFQVNAVYEKISSSGLVASAADRTAFYLAGKFNVNANDAVKLAYTSAGKVNGVTDTEATQFSLGYDHALSKRTTVYALYSKISNKTASNYTFSQATSAGGSNGGLNADPSVWSLGMKHAF